MEIAVIGINHQLAPIEIRERVSFTESKKLNMTMALKKSNIFEVLILSTCNRSEVYIVASDIDKKINAVIAYLKEYSKCENLNDYLIVKQNKEAVRHLFMVTAGLDSLVLGEDQILGQVKEAHTFSMNNEGSGKILNKLFREAITKAKWVKNNYRISENPTSISYVGIKLLKRKINTFKGKSVLIIGAGNMGKLSLTYMLDEDLKNIYITNRTHNKLNDIIASYPRVTPIRYEDRYKVLKTVDILISTTASPHVIFKSENMSKIDQPLVILDLALPRDVDKKIADINSIELYDIDDLQEVIERNIDYRKTMIKPVMKIIEDSIDEFYKWKLWTKIDPLMEDIQRHCEEVEQETLSTIFEKVNLVQKDKELIEKMLSSALKKTMKKPLLNLKQIKDQDKLEGYILMANEMFRM